MGEIPNRQVFSQNDYKKALLPYYHIVACVKQGDMDLFKKLTTKYQHVF